MPQYHVPVPDYDFTIRQKNPYIPTPDYTTIKYYKPQNRPRLNSIVENVNNVHNDNSRTRALSNSSVDTDYEFVRHSYLEDHEENENHISKSTKEHIKQIGVPVIPGIARAVTSSDVAAAPVSTDQNKAFLRHLENHKKFDTITGSRGMDGCELCQIMRKQHQIEYERDNIGDGRRQRTDVRTIFPQINEQEEPAPNEAPIMTRVRYDYEKKRDSEISVRSMDVIEVLQIEQGYALCRSTNGSVGWLPESVIGL